MVLPVIDLEHWTGLSGEDSRAVPGRMRMDKRTGADDVARAWIEGEGHWMPA
jgi:hypothetical protein